MDSEYHTVWYLYEKKPVQPLRKILYEKNPVWCIVLCYHSFLFFVLKGLLPPDFLNLVTYLKRSLVSCISFNHFQQFYLLCQLVSPRQLNRLESTCSSISIYPYSSSHFFYWIILKDCTIHVVKSHSLSHRRPSFLLVSFCKIFLTCLPIRVTCICQ